MKKRSVFLYSIFLLLFVSMLAINADKVLSSTERVLEKDEATRVLSYTPHDPILIQSDADFETQGWPGNGSLDYPYIIEGLNITSESTCISVSDSIAYFVILSCFISTDPSTANPGIQFDNVVFGSVKDCNISRRNGVALLNSFYCTFINNTLTDCDVGFYLDYSTSCSFYENDLIRNTHAFDMFYSDACNITDNSISECGNIGIHLRYCNDFKVIGNIISETNDNSIILIFSDYCTLVNNSMETPGLYVQGNELSNYIHEITGNTVIGRPIAYFLSLSDSTINGNLYGQIIMVNCTRVVLEDSRFQGPVHGVQLGFCTDCIIDNSTMIVEMEVDMNISHSFNCTVRDSQIGYVYLYFSTYCTVDNNEIESVRLLHSHHSMFVDNTLWSSESYLLSGFEVSFSEYCVFINNTVTLKRGHGFELDGAAHAKLIGNTASLNNEHGFFLRGSSFSHLENNTAGNNGGNGFDISESPHTTLINNSAFNNGGGFYLGSSGNSTLSNNSATDDGFFISGGSLIDWIHNFSSNTVNENPVEYLVNVSGVVLQDESYGQLFIINCSDVTVQGLTFNNVSCGIGMAFSTDCSLIENTMISTIRCGIFIYGSVGCLIAQNTVEGSQETGITMSQITNCTITGCTVKCEQLPHTTNDGFHGDNLDNCNLTENSVVGTNHQVGYVFIGLNNCNLRDNSVSQCSVGMELRSMVNCLVEGSIILDNGNGFYGSDLINSTILRNSFSDNQVCLQLNDCVNCTVKQNTILRVVNDGIDVSNSENCHFNENIVKYCRGGLDLGNTFNCSFIANVVSQNDGFGFQVRSGSNNNIFYLNQIGLNGGSNANDDGEDNIWDNGIDTGNYWTDYDGDGYYEIPGEGGSVDRFPIYWDVFPPVISSSGDVEYTEGTRGHRITWNATEVFPQSYEVYRNGTLIESGDWDGSEIVLQIDELAIGIYNFTLIVFDTSGNSATNSVYVRVVEGYGAALDILLILGLGAAGCLGLMLAIVYTRQKKRLK